MSGEPRITMHATVTCLYGPYGPPISGPGESIKITESLNHSMLLCVPSSHCKPAHFRSRYSLLSASSTILFLDHQPCEEFHFPGSMFALTLSVSSMRNINWPPVAFAVR